MRTKLQAALAVSVMTTVVVGGTALSAYARTGNGPITVQNSDVEYSGQVYWYPNGDNHGGMGLTGRLYDRNANGDPVYLNAQVSGYGFTRIATNSNGKGTYVTVNKVVYDPQATRVDNGKVRACNSDAFGDTCAEEYNRR